MGELLTCPAKTSGTPEAKHKGKKQRTPVSKGPVEDAAQVNPETPKPGSLNPKPFILNLARKPKP